MIRYDASDSKHAQSLIPDKTFGTTEKYSQVDRTRKV